MSGKMQRYDEVCEKLRLSAIPRPAPEDVFIGDGDYVEISLEFLKYFVELGKLKPTDSVLDVGSGIGRMAISLAYYLEPVKGRYLGLDPVQKGVQWCRENITSIFSNFQFRHLDVNHEIYNSCGRFSASSLEFPVKDNVIDFIICTSVFSHLYEEDIRNYLKEMSRMLSKSGKIFCTAYTFEGDRPPQDIDIEHLRFSSSPMEKRQSHHVSGYPPLAAVAFPEALFQNFVEDIPGRKATIFPGRWRGAQGPWFQDVVLVE